jgi:hypothetical protein
VQYKYSYILVFLQKPQISDEGKQAFLNLAGADGEIDAYELQDLLNKVFMKGIVLCSYCCK